MTSKTNPATEPTIEPAIRASHISASQIEEAVRGAGLQPIPPSAAAGFKTYLHLLLKWNAKLNLTAIREPKELVQRQFLECIQCAQLLPKAVTLLDFGSGAGFPGIPITLIRKDIHVVLGESHSRKAAFLREVIRTLHLNAEVYDGRIETMAHEQKFDIVTLRAVDRMAEACAEALNWLKEGGTLVVFATTSTEPAIRTATQPITWTNSIPTVGRNDACLLTGQLKSGQL